MVSGLRGLARTRSVYRATGALNFVEGQRQPSAASGTADLEPPLMFICELRRGKQGDTLPIQIDVRYSELSRLLVIWTPSTLPRRNQSKPQALHRDRRPRRHHRKGSARET